eukprot:TRINITY_DN354_c0_g1_i1.p1 TRINITY_DN354_c0_g1~~TRINITY_DN354_c0_g1_i1.p1  ORF type:complete len:151 (+),score=31.03 TRINITY_DN354_c0_g1_i1:56-454(+)
MVSASKVALLSVIAACPAFVVSKLLRAGDSANVQRGTVADKIMINGETVMEGSNIAIGCHQAPKDASSVSVCGAGYKVIANLLTECQEYKQYSEEIGFCDSGKSGCDEKALESGYTQKFNWKAVSYEVVACP